MRIIFLAIFYLASFLNILLMMKFFKWTNSQDFRDRTGDVTTEVGYEEDGYGRIIDRVPYDPRYNPGKDSPHVVYEPITDGPGGTF